MEMVSAKAILYNNKNTESLLEIHPDEQPVSLQFFVRWQNVWKSVHLILWILIWDVRCLRLYVTEKALHL